MTPIINIKMSNSAQIVRVIKIKNRDPLCARRIFRFYDLPFHSNNRLQLNITALYMGFIMRFVVARSVSLLVNNLGFGPNFSGATRAQIFCAPHTFCAQKSNPNPKTYESLSIEATCNVPNDLFSIGQQKREALVPVSQPQKEFSAIISRKRKLVAMEGTQS